jgi:hypothetical protein
LPTFAVAEPFLTMFRKAAKSACQRVDEELHAVGADACEHGTALA